MVIDLDHPACDNGMRNAVTCPLQESRPEDAVVVDDVATDEMCDPVIPAPVTLPVFSSSLCPLLGKCNIPDGSVDPDIDYKIIAARELYAPFKSAGDAPVVQVLLDPPDRVVLCVGRPSDGIKVGSRKSLNSESLKK